MKLLIIGGFGYLGGRLAQYLASRPQYEVVLGSRRELAPPDWLQVAGVVKVVWDQPLELVAVCAGVDAVVHLAAMNAQECAADPVAALDFNAVATARLVQAAVRQGVSRFVYVSTAHVYGSPLTGIITEKNCPLSLHPYATSHRAAEDVVRTAHQQGNIDGCVIRLSNAYGSPADKKANCWTLLVNDLCLQAVTMRRMVLKSSGTQRRDFVPITDVCHAIEHLLHIPKQTIGNGIFNVGGEWSPTIWEMALIVQERCKSVLGFVPELVRAPLQAAELPSDLDFRIDLLRQSGYLPQADKMQEIDRLLEFCSAKFS